MDYSNNDKISIPTIKRYPSYLRVIRQHEAKGERIISATTLAEELSLKAVQVRKDISFAGIEGKPKKGFVISELASSLTHALGWDISTEALIVGMGNLGKAISQYEGFEAYGLRIIAAFDNDVKKVGEKVGSLIIQSMDNLYSFVKSSGVKIAIITVPYSSAEEVANALISSGIKGIWNFAPKDLKVPEDCVIQRTDLAASFAVLSLKMRQREENISL